MEGLIIALVAVAVFATAVMIVCSIIAGQPINRKKKPKGKKDKS